MWGKMNERVGNGGSGKKQQQQNKTTGTMNVQCTQT